MQALYGANMASHPGDDSYGFADGERFLMTIWDSGGTDTIDASAQTLRSIISLVDGTFSSIGLRLTTAELRRDFPAGSAAAPTPTYDGRDNLAIAYGAVIESAIGGSGDDQITGNPSDNQLTGGAGRDTLNGGAGNDTLAGGSEDDQLYGEDGHDNLNGNSGHDLLVGGHGNDSLYAEDGNDVAFGEAGDDLIVLGFGDDRGYGQDGNDVLFGEFGDDLLAGGLGQDTAYGQAGRDQVFGEAGDDVLSGGDDDDAVYGQAGDDRVSGDSGNDVVSGGDGLDTLTGGTGADIFYFERPDGGTDMVMDFNSAEGDHLYVAAAAFGAPVGFHLTTGLGFLTGPAPFPTAATATFYRHTNSQALWFDVDGTGPAGANVLAFLIGNPTLSAADIVFV